MLNKIKSICSYISLKTKQNKKLWTLLSVSSVLLCVLVGMCRGQGTVYGNSLSPSVYLSLWGLIQVSRLSVCRRTCWIVSLALELCLLSSLKLCLPPSLVIKTGMNVNLLHSGKFPSKALQFPATSARFPSFCAVLFFKPAFTLLFLEY